MPPSKEELRALLRQQLGPVQKSVNDALRGEGLETLEPVLTRLGRGGSVPHWFAQLHDDGTLPNPDGKTVGSIVEMILVAVLETSIFKDVGLPPLRINPARGVDLPDLDLGIKSPSENFCTSEPFFSAYERLFGSENDVLVLLTDYQEKKKTPPLRLQITRASYLTKTQIADESICAIARKHRPWLVGKNESWAKKVFRFLAFVNQSDWRARWLLQLVDDFQDESRVRGLVEKARADFAKQNLKRKKKDLLPIPDEELRALTDILGVTPIALGIIDAADNWVIEALKDVARPPSDNEWNRLVRSPLDGRIGMSFALQWRFNFGRLFGASSNDEGEADHAQP
jgi:hypothetical protein